MINSNKLNNLISIIFMFLSNDSVSVTQIKDRFHISVKTAERYLDDLSFVLPIYSTKRGTYAISSTFHLRSTFLNSNEKQTLFEILEDANKRLDSNIVHALKDKLTSIMPEENNINLGNLIIDSSSWGQNVMSTKLVSEIENAITNTKTLLIEYSDNEGNITTREIDPHTLLLKQGSWYVYAFCHIRNELRLFKLNRILTIEQTAKTFTRKKIDNLESLLSDWYKKLDTLNVKFELDKQIKGEVEEWLGINNVYKGEDGKYYATAKLPSNNIIISKILSFGNKIKILSPNKLIVDTKNYIQDLYKIYY